MPSFVYLCVKSIGRHYEDVLYDYNAIIKRFSRRSKENFKLIKSKKEAGKERKKERKKKQKNFGGSWEV